MHDKLLSIAQGRSLRFAPDWSCSEARVILDCNSGDYWVVSLLASMALDRLQSAGTTTLPELEENLEPFQLYANLPAALGMAMQSLVESGLVQCAQPPAQTEAILHSRSS